jgi:hypothetical protein
MRRLGYWRERRKLAGLVRDSARRVNSRSPQPVPTPTNGGWPPPLVTTAGRTAATLKKWRRIYAWHHLAPARILIALPATPVRVTTDMAAWK